MVKKFEDVLKIVNGKNQKKVQDPKGHFPIYGSGGIMGYADDYICEADTTIIGRKGSINNPIFVREPFWNVDTAFGLVPDRSILLPKYLYFFCKHFDFEKLNTTVTIPSLTKANLLKVEINLPNMNKQEQIVKELDYVVNLLELQKKRMEAYNTLIKSRFVEMFGDPESNPMDWTKVPMGNHITTLVDFNANGSYAYLDSNVTMYDHPDFALMVRTIDLEKNDFEHDVKYIDENAYNILSKSKVYGNEIIMNKIGSAGKVYLMPCLYRPVSLGRNAFMFRFDKEINAVFLFHQLTSAYGEKEIMQHVRGAVTKTITKDAARSVRIIVPPKSFQDDFESFVHEIDKSKFATQKALTETQQLFDSLMQKYFG